MSSQNRPNRPFYSLFTQFIVLLNLMACAALCWWIKTSWPQIVTELYDLLYLLRAGAGLLLDLLMITSIVLLLGYAVQLYLGQQRKRDQRIAYEESDDYQWDQLTGEAQGMKSQIDTHRLPIRKELLAHERQLAELEKSLQTETHSDGTRRLALTHRQKLEARMDKLNYLLVGLQLREEKLQQLLNDIRLERQIKQFDDAHDLVNRLHETKELFWSIDLILKDENCFVADDILELNDFKNRPDPLRSPYSSPGEEHKDDFFTDDWNRA